MARRLQVQGPKGNNEWNGETMMSVPADRISSWLETQYCASVAATLLARNEYFELLEDAMVPPERLVQALTNWKQCASQAHVLGGMVGNA
jgi:hypothetical protein